MRPAVQPEFSRVIRVDDLVPTGRAFVGVAGEQERAQLARRFDLVALAHLEVRGAVTPARGGMAVLLSARLRAEVTQTCVVTLAPVASRLDVQFKRLYAADAPGEFADADQHGDVNGGEIQLDGDDDDIDPLVGGLIDVGEAAAEQLALELDPYPRAPGTSFEQSFEEVGRGKPLSSAPTASSFSALRCFAASTVPSKRRK